MMLEPGLTAGRWISSNPARGPDDSSRRSLQIFESFSAVRLSDAGELDEGAGVLGGLDQVVAVTSGCR